ncbi:MAG: hypothetical protein ACREFO_16485, partial [Acetobacteraceae bacterium]
MLTLNGALIASSAWKPTAMNSVAAPLTDMVSAFPSAPPPAESDIELSFRIGDLLPAVARLANKRSRD